MLAFFKIGLRRIGNKMNGSGVKGGMVAITSIGLMCLMALSVVAPVASAATEPSWNYAFPMGEARSQATVVQADNGVVYVIGGYTTTGALATTLNSAYNPLSGQWTALAPLPLATRGACGGLGADGRIFVFDGMIAGTQIYNITTNSWSSGTPVLAVGHVWEAKSAMNGDKAYVFGGEISGVGSYVNQTSIYNITADTWSSGSDMPYGVKAGAVVADDENAYYFGGANVSGMATTNSSRYNFATDTWSMIAPLPSAVCAEGAVIAPDGLIYVFGGADRAMNVAMGAVYSDTYTYDRSSNTWTAVDDMNIARAWLGAAVADNKVLAIGGNTPSTVYTTVESLDTLQNQLENLQEQLTLLQNQLAQANGDISDLESQNALLKAQLVELSAQLNQTRDSMTSDLDDAKSSADTANMIGMIAVVLAAVAIVVAVVAMMRKKS